MKPTVCAIICAAGKGLRAGFEKNKLLTLIDGEPVIKKTLDAFSFPAIKEIILSVSEEDKAEMERLCADYSSPAVKIVLGGKDRFSSVFNALKSAESDIVLIHDGARPFVSRSVIEGCIQSVKTNGSGICAVDALDTVACVQKGKILSVPDRATLKQIQTPQGFFRENILSAYESAAELKDRTYTDDSSVFLRFCGTPYFCDGARENCKLTYAEDFRSPNRYGFGVDTHAFGKAQDYIRLGGVKLPSESGLIAHSDGDVLVHAVMDALLSGAGLRDIGYYFPDNDEKWKDANSLDMLKQVLALVNEQGLCICNLSIAVQAEKPRLSKYVDDMKNTLSSVLRIDPSRIGITVGTNEGLGYVGEGKGITVYAYTLLQNQ